MTNRVFKDANGQRVTMSDIGVTWLSDERIAELGLTEVSADYQPPVPLDSLKSAKLAQVDTWTAAHITGGFVSAATGASYTYDSDAIDQDNIKTMYLASLSSAFETDATYAGHIPIRARAEGATAKTVLLHDKAQMQTLIDDMARHIGACKKRGWELQAAVAAATTAEEVAAIAW